MTIDERTIPMSQSNDVLVERLRTQAAQLRSFMQDRFSDAPGVTEADTMEEAATALAGIEAMREALERIRDGQFGYGCHGSQPYFDTRADIADAALNQVTDSKGGES